MDKKVDSVFSRWELVLFHLDRSALMLLVHSDMKPPMPLVHFGMTLPLPLDHSAKRVPMLLVHSDMRALMLLVHSDKSSSELMLGGKLMTSDVQVWFMCCFDCEKKVCEDEMGVVTEKDVRPQAMWWLKAIFESQSLGSQQKNQLCILYLQLELRLHSKVHLNGISNLNSVPRWGWLHFTWC